MPIEPIRLDLPSTKESITRVTEAVSAMLEQLPLSEEAAFDLKLAAQEAIVNAVEHGNKCDPCKQVHLSCGVQDGRIIIVVGDEGGGFCPADVPDPTLPENILREYGRGIFLMQNLCDELRFNDKGNEVTMVKKLPA